MKLVFELIAQDVNVSTELIRQKQLVKELTKELVGVDQGSKKFEDLAAKLVDAKTKVSTLTAEQKKLNKEFAATLVPTDSLAGLRLEYSKLTEQITKLSKAERESDAGQALVKEANKIKNEINGIQESLGNFTGSVGNYKKALISVFDLVSAGLVTGGIERGVEIIASAIQGGVVEFSKYEKSLDNLSALTGVTGKALDGFADKANQLTTIKIGDSEIVNTASGIVEAFKLVGGAQPELLKSADSLADVTQQAIVLSAASQDELKPSVEALTTTLGQFQLGAGDAARVANELAAGAKAGASEIPDTTAAIKEFGTTAANTNITTTESIALIQTLAEQQLKGAEAGTSLRNILAKLASADVLPRGAIQAFKDAGVNINILKDTTLPLEARLVELGKLSGDTSKLVKIFGLENLNAATILTGNVDRYKEFNAAITGTQEAYTQAEINSNNLTTSYENLKKEGLNVLVEGFGVLSPLLSFVISLFAKGLGYLGGFVALLIEAPKFVNENKEAFIGLITGLTLLNGQLILASLNSIRLAAAERLRAAITTTVTAAQWLLNAAMTANPIGLIVTAISLLVLGFKALYDNSETVRGSISGLGNVASEIFTIIKEAVTAFIEGFNKLNEGDISGALDKFGEGLVKSNPIGIALTQGERLGKAFNDGFNSKLQDEARDKAEAERDDRQVESAKLKAERLKKINGNVSKQEAEAAKQRKQELDDQIKRLSEIRKAIRELDAQTITNEFDKKEIELQNQRLAALEKVEEARLNIEKKIKKQRGVPTENDKAELALISEQTASIIAAYDQQFTAVQSAREKALLDAKNKLAELSAQVVQLAAQNGEKLASAENEIVNADFTQAQAQLLDVLNERKKALTKQLAEQTITQKQYKKQYLQAQAAYNIGSAQLEKERAQKIIAIADALRDAKIAAAKSELDAQLLAIDVEIQGLQAKDASAEEFHQLELKRIEQRKAAELEYEKKVRDATTEATTAKADSFQKAIEGEKKVSEDTVQSIDDEKEKRLQLQDEILSAANSISGSIFEIEKNRIASQLKEATTALDTEYQKKKDAAQGNQALLAKLDTEYQEKKAALEKDAAKKRKKIALIEAGIQGALAVIHALATGNFVTAALAAVTTAAQIAVISSQEFAKGGTVKFGMFGGRPHSAGGTKGAFSDGTQVEVEKDEMFVILNRRASAAIRKLSDFNYSHGGNKFAAGGSLDFTPQISQPGASSDTNTIVVVSEFSDEQVQYFAQQVADRTANKTQEAVAKGLNDSNRLAEREQILTDSREV